MDTQLEFIEKMLNAALEMQKAVYRYLNVPRLYG